MIVERQLMQRRREIFHLHACRGSVRGKRQVSPMIPEQSQNLETPVVLQKVVVVREATGRES